jgi:hypothetical protein
MAKKIAQTTDLFRAKRGVAALAACIVQTVNESDPTFQIRFLERLGKAYYQFRDDTDGDVLQELELFSWTREYLTGWNPITGQGKPLGN